MFGESRFQYTWEDDDDSDVEVIEQLQDEGVLTRSERIENALE